MFFNISVDLDSAFPNNYNYGNFYINCDDGWNEYKFDNRLVLAKGYADHYSLAELSFDANLTDTGNYCLIDISDSIVIRHNINRAFPLGYKHNTLTNLFKDSDYTRIWINDAVSVNIPWDVKINKVSIDTSIPTEVLSSEQVISRLFDILNKDITDFFATNQPRLKVWCSGGVDTLLLYSLLHYNNKHFDLIKDEHIEEDYFYQHNHRLLNQYWGYKQIHHWTSPTWFATGSHGDEYFLRGPTAIAMITSWHDIEFMKYIKHSDYHYHHFLRYSDMWAQSWATRRELQETYPTVESLNQQVVNLLLYDHQHWHLGNTLTWTPFKNINLVKTLLQCPVEQLLEQFTDASITKELIERVNSNLLATISQYKNVNNWENLQKLYDFHDKKILINQ